MKCNNTFTTNEMLVSNYGITLIEIIQHANDNGITIGDAVTNVVTNAEHRIEVTKMIDFEINEMVRKHYQNGGVHNV